MKQLFKTTLLAAAVAATCGTAVAGTVAVTKQTHSQEGLLGVTGTQLSNDITYTLGAAYQEGDKITLTFPADTLDKDTPIAGFPGTLVIAPVAGERAGLTLGLLNHDVGTDADFVTYRVTNIAPDGDNGSTVGAEIGGGTDKLNISYDVAKLLSAPVTVTFSSQTAVGDVLDAGGDRTATIAEAKTQFSTVAVADTRFANTIDVKAERQLFVEGNTDTLSFSIDNIDTSSY